MTELQHEDLIDAWDSWFGSYLTPYDSPNRVTDYERLSYAPQSYGFVSFGGVHVNDYNLTLAGEQLLSAKQKDEVFLRQMLKFQIPSPYHKPTAEAANFCVKPYLEMLRLVRTMGTLKFDELQLFGMQLTDYHEFNEIVRKIEEFRMAKADHKGSYRMFKAEYLNNELKEIYRKRIQKGETKTRESKDDSLANFLRTQSNNMRDYADACFRYLRATRLVNVSQVGKSLSIVPERIPDVDYILQSVSRDPVFVNDEKEYVSYLGNNSIPRLLTDDRERILERIQSEFPNQHISATNSINEMKNILADLLENRKKETITAQIAEIKDYKLYDNIQCTFDQIIKKEFYDNPLMLEWNTWRAMTMLDGGNIKANFNFDDYGQPLSTATGNMADIVCDYGDFMICVEVTMASGQRQFEMEGEPVTRHLGKLKVASGKPCYCLFIAPTINEATVSFFFTLHKTNLAMYGGKSTIIPLSIMVFRKMLEDSYKASYTPNPSYVHKFFEASNTIADSSDNEAIWYEKLKEKALHWLE